MMLAARLIGIMTVLALAIGLVAWTNRPDVRYSNYACQYGLIYNQTGPVDLVTIGSSRSLQGIGVEAIAEELEIPVAYNLAKNWRGQGINYSILADLLANRDVGTVLVEANLPESGTFHAHFFLVGTLGDWWRSNQFRSRPDGFAAIGTTTSKLTERVVEQASLALTGQLPALSGDQVDAATGFCRTREETVRPSYLEEQRARYEQYYVGQSWSWDLFADEAQHDFGFYRAMVDLAAAHDVELVFYHINQAYYSTLDPDFAAVFEANVGAPILIPPASLTREIEAMGGYADTTHMTASGRDTYSRWLAGALAEQRARES